MSRVPRRIRNPLTRVGDTVTGARIEHPWARSVTLSVNKDSWTYSRTACFCLIVALFYFIM